MLIISAVCSILLCTSCTRLVYSNNDYMKSFKTKNEVIARFGMPSEKKDGNIYGDLLDI